MSKFKVLKCLAASQVTRPGLPRATAIITMNLTPQPDYAAAPSTSARASGETLIAGPCQPCPPPRWSPLHGGRLIRELAGSISERLVCKQAGGSSVTRVTKGGFPCHYIHRSTPSPLYIIL
ncbi:hypothetical protein E2C01_017191 [Portunus trituberculatus]|uniref:Uncharacterized protein n=1 Tax=Portunus trituberculatus TaxID=210409 RepID=A0A5B7DSS0_PORTR|nr:hypothetical protein [Portunus trituberculatus]